MFRILEKDKHHHSSTYNNASMPNMNRLIWDGIALHAGNLPGYPASHGCVRLPLKFSDMLYGITRKGMTVVIADEHSQPSSVTHPGMVLGDYARHEFAAVDAALLKSQYSAAHVDKPAVTSVVVSSKDRTITVVDDDKVVARGSMSLSGGDKPLGNSVYILKASDRANDSLTWSGVGYGKTDREDLTKALERVTAEPGVREEIRKRMQGGLTVVTTDETHTEAYRVSNFTIIEGMDQ